uniref:lysozyme n=1 Tax=Panagrellus redivivus TaxID=6233 RepID=A0A7E4W096_PANRE
MNKLFVTLFIAISAVGIQFAAADCYGCICQHESGCKPIGCEMDLGSLSCGYFQIKLPYYEDCGQPGKRNGESTEDAWKRCSDDYTCALTCVKNYINRYAFECPNKGECERISRLHNGGPQGCSAARTDVYWAAVKACCGCS